MRMCDADSGIVCGMDLLIFDGNIEALWAQVPAKFFEMCERVRVRPTELRVCRTWIEKVGGAFYAKLNVNITRDFDLPRWRRLSMQSSTI